ncbi:pentatricopeptide repeat-containing protein [Pyrus ussuriensis x Pyrus communis]|uniref:Pentatricopeptide repeat-containing protein n=1 Tax=Pyrus ussuriensis x Pyrus communis TaxID=2448454 RepID=A0A5N5FLG9_9ROSA|nr:pentatricopeptide repeat-containing protein [Pyrus ussuriensis x Pyrus communis]
MTRRTLLRPPLSLSAARILPARPPRPYKNGGSSSEASNSYSASSFSTNPRWVFTNSLPPPEWVEPFNDVTDVVSNTQNFEPSRLVAQILNLLDGSPTMEANLDSYYRTFLIKLSPNFVSYVLKSVELRGKTALRFFGWAEMNFLMTSRAAKSLIKSFGCLGMVDELLWVWRRMKKIGIEPSLYAYNFLLNGLVNSMFIESAERVFEVMEGGKIAPDIMIYNTMIKGYCKGGKTQKAMEKAMEGRNVEPDKITYMTSIQGCYSEGDVDSCLGLYQEMDEKGLEIPSHAYRKCEEAYAVFEDMIRRDVKPMDDINAMFYPSLIDGLGKAGRLDEAERLFDKMVVKGCPHDSYCYNAHYALIDALAKCGKTDEALALFKKMEEEGWHRNEEALKPWHTMIDKSITPNVASFRALSIWVCLSGKVARACKILDELAPMGVIPETAFEDMINVLSKAGRVKEACNLADGIVDTGREIPGRIRTVLINALRKAGNADLAMKLMHSKIGIGYDRMGSLKRRVEFRILFYSLSLNKSVFLRNFV